jgi:hypothetical protein
MTGESWDQVKAARPDTPARRRGYEKAGRSIRVAMEIHALHEKAWTQPTRTRGAR